MTWQYRGPITGHILGSEYIHLSERDYRIIKGRSPIQPRTYHRRVSPTDSEVEDWWEDAEEMMIEGMLYMNRRKLATFTPTRSAFRKWKPHDETQLAPKVTFNTEHTTVYYRLFNHELLGTRKPEVHYARRFDCYSVLTDDVSKTFDKLAEEDEEYLYGPAPKDIKLEPEQEEQQQLEASKQAPIVSAKAVMDELLKTGMAPFSFHPLSPPPPVEIQLPVPNKCTLLTHKGAIQVDSLEPNLYSTKLVCQSTTNASTTHGLDNDVKQAPAMDDTPAAATTARKEIDDDLPIRKPVINSWLGDDAIGPIVYRSRRDRELTGQRQEAELETDTCEDEKDESESHLVVASTTSDHNSDQDEESIDSDVTLIADFTVNDMLNDVKETPMTSSTSSMSMPKRFIPLERTTPKPPKIRAPKIHPEISPDVKLEAKKLKSISAFKSFKSSIQSAFRCMFACVSKH